MAIVFKEVIGTFSCPYVIDEYPEKYFGELYIHYIPKRKEFDGYWMIVLTGKDDGIFNKDYYCEEDAKKVYSELCLMDAINTQELIDIYDFDFF